MTNKIQKNRGFTLVELSIVLVIIGLLVGGVLVGASLIKNAQIRSLMGEENQYKQAVGAFRVKYDALPGDMTNSAQYFSSETWTSIGNGDGRVQWRTEGPQAWRQMELAGLISQGSFVHNCIGLPSLDWNSVACRTISVSTGDGVTVPASKAFPQTNWAIYYSNKTKRNVLQLAGNNGNMNIGSGNGITPLEAYSVDVKEDDGLITSGSIQSRSGNYCSTDLQVGGYATSDNDPNSDVTSCPLFIALGF
jgi:prepilin-type N-terminal cleavage/methylation domain-containing protein